MYRWENGNVGGNKKQTKKISRAHIHGFGVQLTIIPRQFILSFDNLRLCKDSTYNTCLPTKQGP